MNDNTCTWIRCQLPGFIDGELTDLVNDQISEHLDACQACQSELESQVTQVAMTIEQLVAAEPRVGLADRVIQEIGAQVHGQKTTPTTHSTTLPARRTWWPNVAAAVLMFGTVGLLAWLMSLPVEETPIDTTVARATKTVVGHGANDAKSVSHAKPETAAAAPTSSSQESVAGNDRVDPPITVTETATETTPVETDDRGDHHASSDDDLEDLILTDNDLRIVRGDIDADGVFTPRDVLLLSAAVEQGPQSVRCAAAADFDGDNELTPSDVGDAIFALNLEGTTPGCELRTGGVLACDLAMCP